MASTDVTIADFAAMEFPYKSPKTIERWAREGKIKGAKKDPGGRWVVNLSDYRGIRIAGANDIGVDEDVFKRLSAQ